MHTTKAILVRVILRQELFFGLPQKIRESRNMRKGRNIHIIGITATFGCQSVNFFIFSNLIRQPAYIIKTKIKFFIKHID